MARALGLPGAAYRKLERDSPLPIHLLARFCVLARCSPEFIRHGAGEIAHKPVPLTMEDDGLIAPQNRCGAPCVYGHFWCRQGCEHARK